MAGGILGQRTIAMGLLTTVFSKRHGSVAHRLVVGSVVSGDCVQWSGKTNPQGYGVIVADGRRLLTHRAAWQLHSGIELLSGQLVCHRCDNPRCVKPEHLFVGTPQDNASDRDSKHRGKTPNTQKGDRHHVAKLTAEDVRAIRTRASSGERQRRIAADYGVGQSVISRVVSGLAWRSVGKV